jgi:toxin CcdB
MPVFSVNGQDCLLETPKMAAVPLRTLKVPVASLAAQQDRVVAAMDFLFNGY